MINVIGLFAFPVTALGETCSTDLSSQIVNYDSRGWPCCCRVACFSRTGLTVVYFATAAYTLFIVFYQIRN